MAALVVAGGQGTRLGFDGPKGNFPISPIKQKTLFRIFAETIQAVTRRYGATCPWYVMTSPMNYTQTVEIFKADNYYGLDAKDVFIFQQGTLAQLRLRRQDSPGGQGPHRPLARRSRRLYPGPGPQRRLADMQRRGVEYISYWQVDNPLGPAVRPAVHRAARPGRGRDVVAGRHQELAQGEGRQLLLGGRQGDGHRVQRPAGRAGRETPPRWLSGLRAGQHRHPHHQHRLRGEAEHPRISPCLFTRPSRRSPTSTSRATASSRSSPTASSSNPSSSTPCPWPRSPSSSTSSAASNSHRSRTPRARTVSRPDPPDDGRAGRRLAGSRRG